MRMLISIRDVVVGSRGRIIRALVDLTMASVLIAVGSWLLGLSGKEIAAVYLLASAAGLLADVYADR